MFAKIHSGEGVMKIAIPLMKERIAPHFGASSEMLLVEVKNAAIERMARWNVGGDTPLEIARRLVDLGVEVIICGGINRIYKEWLLSQGISVEDNKKGNAKGVLKEWLAR